MEAELAATVIRPQAGPQETFLSSSADIAIYGGAAGGGKTWALLLETLRHIDNPDFGAVTFRRESPQITNEGGLWDESEKLFPLVGASSIKQPLQWTFPSGARETFTHLQHESDVLNWQGGQIPLIKFDELTHFTKKQFFYMLSRNRSTCGVKPYVRATCNPDPDSWVAEFIGWWIGDDGYPIAERSGVIRWFANINDVWRWADSLEELIEQYPECKPKSVTFIASSVFDNRILLEKDPGYLANLQAQTLEQQMRLLKGNWKFRNEGGIVKREWIKHSPLPPGVRLVRAVVAVDPSGSSKVTSDEVGIIVAAKGDDGRGYVLDDVSGILTPENWARRSVNSYHHYQSDIIVGESNFGGDMVESNIRSIDNSVNYKSVRASRGKLVRLEPVASLYERGLITHVKNFDKLESQLCSYNPETFDKSPDRMDALVWAFTELMLSGNNAKQTKLGGV